MNRNIFNPELNALLPSSLMPRFVLPPLPYAYNALEPFIDEQTLRIHHTRLHRRYVQRLNLAISRYPELYNKTLGELLFFSDQLPSDVQGAIINNGGGHYNHTFFWNIMTPNSTGEPVGTLKDAINTQFGSFENFKRAFTEAALGVFGSGYAWLVLSPGGRLEIITTANQATPVPLRRVPIIGIDVWEHAYYLKYLDNRENYINEWFNVVNWEYANQIYEAALANRKVQ